MTPSEGSSKAATFREGSGRELGRAVYSIFTSPHHAPQKDHLPTLIVTPAGKPRHTLYVYMHTNYNQEVYLLTPSDAGDLCVAKLFPPIPESLSSGSSSGHSHGGLRAVKCEASRNLRWSIVNTGVAMPCYKLTLPNPDGGEDQPLIQISKTNKNSPYWLMTYYTYAGHLVPPNRIEFGRIEKSELSRGGDGGTRVTITGKSEEQKAVWKTLGEGNEDMVEWCVLCGALNVIDDEVREAARAAGQPLRPPPAAAQSRNGGRAERERATARELHPTGRSLNGALSGLSLGAPQNNGAPPLRPPVLHKARSFDSRPVVESGFPRDALRGSPDLYSQSPSHKGQNAPPSFRGAQSRPPPNVPIPKTPLDQRRPSAPAEMPWGERFVPDSSRSGLSSQFPYAGTDNMPRLRANSADPAIRTVASGSDPRFQGSGAGMISTHRGQRLGQSIQQAGYRPSSGASRSGDTRSTTETNVSHHSPSPVSPGPQPWLTQPLGHSPRGPPSSSSAAMRSAPQANSSRATGPLPPNSLAAERTMSAGNVRRHERTSSLDTSQLPDLQNTGAVPGPPDHRRQAGREPSAYQPGQRRFDKLNSPVLATSPILPYDLPERTPSRGSPSLSHEPEFRFSPSPTLNDGDRRGDTHSATIGAAEMIKAQRMNRPRQISHDAGGL